MTVIIAVRATDVQGEGIFVRAAAREVDGNTQASLVEGCLASVYPSSGQSQSITGCGGGGGHPMTLGLTPTFSWHEPWLEHLDFSEGTHTSTTHVRIASRHSQCAGFSHGVRM